MSKNETSRASGDEKVSFQAGALTNRLPQRQRIIGNLVLGGLKGPQSGILIAGVTL